MKNHNTIKEISELKTLKKGIVSTFEATDSLIKSAKDKSRQALAEAILCGQKLNRAKDILGHGSFMKWCKSELPKISHETINRYMRLSKSSDLTKLSPMGLQKAYVALGIVTEDEPGLSNGEASTPESQSASKPPSVPCAASKDKPLTNPGTKKKIVQTRPTINPDQMLSRPKYLMDQLHNNIIELITVRGVPVSDIESITLKPLQELFEKHRPAANHPTPAKK